MPVPEKPTIRLIFTGLQAFFFDSEGTSCRVGMHNQAPSHQLCVKVTVIYAGEKRTIDLSEYVKGYDLHLNVINPKTKGVEVYKNGSFERGSDECDSQDFRWVIGLRSEEFHGEIPIDHSVLRPSFHTNNGLFYTHKKIPARLTGGKECIDKVLGIAEEIGANIELDGDDSEAVLTFGINGEQSLHLRKKPNTRYEINIKNDCPKDLDIGSEFKLYYKAFLSVAPAEQYDITSPTLNSAKVSAKAGVASKTANASKARGAKAGLPGKAGKAKTAFGTQTKPCAPVCGEGDYC